MTKCVKLRCEYQENPIGIDIKNPRFSWQIISKEKNVVQLSYTIQCSINASFDLKSIIWDSKEVKTNQSNQVKYTGETLQAYNRIYWRVMVTTNVSVSEFSDINYFEMGLLDIPWQGQWITSINTFELNGRCPVLIKRFNLDNTPNDARLYITSLGMYKVYINDKEVDQDILAPGWTSYNNILLYQTYDVSDMLVSGDNVISVVLGSGWYQGRFVGGEKTYNLYGDTIALLSQLIVNNEDQDRQIIATDDSWISDESAILYSEIYDGEKYDARLDNGYGFDSFKSEDKAKLYNPPNDFKIIAKDTLGVKVINKIKPIDIITTPKGDSVIDFGQNMVGWVKVKAKGNNGDIIHLKHGEIMLDDEFFNVNMRSAKTEAIYILKGDGDEIFEPHFTFFGFRYVKLENYPGVIDINNFEGIVISSDLEYGGEFNCSNTKVNKLYQNILWGQKGNFVDVPTDCPQRDERFGWTGDTQMFASTACYNSSAITFYKKWLRDVAFDQYTNGGIPFIVPDVLLNNMSSSAWGDACIIVPMALYDFYKDEEIIKSQYNSMKKWVEYIREQADNEVLWNTGFHFGDWLAKDGYGIKEIHGATPIDLVATAFYYNSTKLLSKAAKITGNIDDYNSYEDLSKRIKQAFNNEFVTKSGRLSGETQTSYTLALHFDLLDDEKAIQASYQLAKLVERENYKITTGFVGTPYIANVLSKHGYNEHAYKMLLNEECPGWLYQVNMGATTIWERWDSLLPNGKVNDGSMNSFNHYAYGSIAHWLFTNVLGIQGDDGFKTFNISPKPSKSLSNASGGFESLYGRIESSWEIKCDKIYFSFSIPCNTKANICLPKAKYKDIEYEGKSIESQEGLIISVRSGNYSFSYSYD